MIHLKSGDTDGLVTFTLRTGGQPADLTGKTATATLVSSHLGIRREIALAIDADPTTGRATWQPTTADYEVLLPSTYSVEIVATGPSGERAHPTRGYDTIAIQSRL